MFPFFKPPIENKHQFLMFLTLVSDIVFSKATETSASSLSFLAHGVFRPTPQLSINSTAPTAQGKKISESPSLNIRKIGYTSRFEQITHNISDISGSFVDLQSVCFLML
jgi:hypothetical protein